MRSLVVVFRKYSRLCSCWCGNHTLTLKSTARIYYGTRDIFKIFNPNSFIYFDVENPEESLSQIVRLETNRSAYEMMLKQSILRDGARTVHENFVLSNSKIKANVRRLLEGGENCDDNSLIDGMTVTAQDEMVWQFRLKGTSVDGDTAKHSKLVVRCPSCWQQLIHLDILPHVVVLDVIVPDFKSREVEHRFQRWSMRNERLRVGIVVVCQNKMLSDRKRRKVAAYGLLT